MVLGKLHIHVQKLCVPISYIINKSQLKCIRDLYIRPETIKLLEENIEKNHLDTDLSNEVLHLTPKALAMRTK